MIESILKLIRENNSFAITTHIRPDGDAIGSELALLLFLRKIGKEAFAVNSDTTPFNLTWMPHVQEIEVFDGSMSQRKHISAADVVFVVDTNGRERIGKVSGPIDATFGRKVLIDHHPNPESWFDISWVREKATSAGELIYELIAAYDASAIDQPIATALYTAIMTDTGSFKFDGTTPATHRMIADIMERGNIEPAPIHVNVFDNRSMAGLQLLAAALQSIVLRNNGQLGYMVITQQMVRDLGIGLDETEGFVNYILSIEGVEVGVMFSETDSGVKASFRSKGTLVVNDWARAFGGGGHRFAAGAYVRKTLGVVVEEILEAADRLVPGLESEDEGMVGKFSEEDEQYLASLMQMKSENGK